MKKLINFEKHEEIQALANKKYGGNFSKAVNSIMGIALCSDDFCNDIDRSSVPVCGDPIGSSDAIEFTKYMQSDSAKIANMPKRFTDAVMMGFDASLFNERVKMMFNCKSGEARGIASKLIYDLSPITEQGKYIKVAAELASIFLSMKDGEGKPATSEKDYHENIVSFFNNYFDCYEFVGSEVITSDGADRIDILATCKKTDRDVIIELKLGGKSAHKQLRSYAYEFEDPILVNISEDEVKNKRDGIIYLTYDEIGVEGI